jgi:kynurenine 3-monooxygenase
MDGAGSVVRNARAEQDYIQVSDEHPDAWLQGVDDPCGTKRRQSAGEERPSYLATRRLLLIALPNTDGSFTCILFLPHAGGSSFETLRDERSVIKFLETRFFLALPLIPGLSQDFLAHPTGTLGAVHCFPWRVGAKALLLGDAAHALVPFHGQGMNCAFEGCMVLNQLLGKHEDWESLYCGFEASRKANAEAIADMAGENYAEMRDAVMDPKFHLCKKLEWRLEAPHPQRFISSYAMAMFHRIPYRIAPAGGEIQATILMQTSIDRVEDVGLDLADRLVLEN